MIVMKFGGSSVESAEAIRRVAAIVREHSERPLAVVVSAMGKTTDQLFAIARLAAAGDVRSAIREQTKLRRFHWTESSRLARGSRGIVLNHQLGGLFDELAEVVLEIAGAKALSPRHSDAVLSFGERISSLIVTEGFLQNGIDAVHLDAQTVIVTNANHTNAAVQFVETNALLRRKVSRERVTVLGGFIAATQFGVPTTLGRGGSDYTAAIVGAALAADEIQIWTDVDGMLTGDPRMVSNPHCLKSISYAEAEQLAKAGAKVLHPATVIPAIRQRIPIAIRNSRNPCAPGTRIMMENPGDRVVVSIACRKGLALLNLVPRNTPVTGDFGSAIWDAFQKAGVEFVGTSRKEICLLVTEASLTEEFLDKLCGLAEVDLKGHRALVNLVGHNASENPANLARG